MVVGHPGVVLCNSRGCRDRSFEVDEADDHISLSSSSPALHTEAEQYRETFHPFTNNVSFWRHFKRHVHEALILCSFFGSRFTPRRLVEAPTSHLRTTFSAKQKNLHCGLRRSRVVCTMVTRPHSRRSPTFEAVSQHKTGNLCPPLFRRYAALHVTRRGSVESTTCVRCRWQNRCVRSCDPHRDDLPCDLCCRRCCYSRSV